MFDVILMALVVMLAGVGYAMARLRRFDAAFVFVLLSIAVAVVGGKVATERENNHQVDISKCSLIGKGIDLTDVGNNHRSIYKCENNVIYIQ